MKDKTKYMLIGMIIGIVIGMTMLYLLITFRIIRPFGLGGFTGFARYGNFTNFTRPPRGG